ncbi:MAG: exopolysaccharide biosynthesis polyprenyl glycosylphosphotransferase [Candidatus Jorgensenbacteria bacterium]
MSLLKKAALFIGDILLLYAALTATLFIRYGMEGFSVRLAAHVIPFSAIFIAWVLTIYLSDLYNLKSFSNPTALARNLFIAIAIAAGLSVALFYLFSGFFELTPKTNLFIFAVTFFVFDYGWRLGLLRVFTSGAANVIFLGDSPLMRELAAHLAQFPHAGYRIAAEFPNAAALTFPALAQTIHGNGATLLVVQPSLTDKLRTLHSIYQTLSLGVAAISFPDFYEFIFEKEPLEELGESWFIENISTRRPFYDRIKRFIDVVLGSILMLVLFPFMLLAALATVVFSSGAAVFAQERIGKNGAPFTLYKLRTMRVQKGGIPWPEATETGDARVTTVGKFLRYTHIDEFPQLWNVIRGDISFTGPRPESAALVQKYRELPFYEMRHVVKPGVTGWAQINYKPSASIGEAHEKLKYDLYYVKNRSFFLDILIILKTIRYLITSLK